MEHAADLVRALSAFPLTQLALLSIVVIAGGLIYLMVKRSEKRAPAEDRNRVATMLDIADLRQEMQKAVSERTGEIWKRIDADAVTLSDHGERLASIEGRDDRPPRRRPIRR